MFVSHGRRRATRFAVAALLIIATAAVAIGADEKGAAPATAPAAPSRRAPADAATAPPTEAALRDAIDALGAADAAERERAAARLWSAGPAAEPLLKSAAAGEDVTPEVAARARRVLEDLEAGLDPGSPADVVALTREYHRAGDDRRRRLVQQLGVAGVPGWRVVARLWAREGNARRRAAVFGPVAGSLADAARVVLLTPGAGPADEDGAAALLEMAAALGGSGSANDYAVFALQRGRIDDALRRWREAPPADAARAASVLATLLYTKGDLAAARAAAVASPDATLRHKLAREAADWKAVTPPPGPPPGGNATVEQLAMQALHAHRSGNDAEAARRLALVRASAGKDAGGYWKAVDPFLFTGRHQEGIDLLVEMKQPAVAFALLCAQLRQREAFALVDAYPKRDDGGGGTLAAVRLQLAAAVELHALGETADARKRLDAAYAAHGESKDAAILAALLEAELALRPLPAPGAKPPRVELGGRLERLALAALAAEPNELREPRFLLARLWPDEDRPYDVGAWWQFLRRTRDRDAAAPAPEPAAAFETLRGIVEGTLPPRLLDAQLEVLQGEAARVTDPRQARAGAPAARQHAPRAGRHEKALAFFTQLAAGDNLYLLRQGGDYLAALGRWADAAAWYGRAHDVPAPAATRQRLVWLRDLALSKAGDVAAGDAARARPPCSLGDRVARGRLTIELSVTTGPTSRPSSAG